MEPEMKKIYVDEITYKKIKKNQKAFSVTTKDIIKELNSNDDVIVYTDGSKSSIETKIKKVYDSNDLNKLNKVIETPGFYDFIKDANNLVVLEFKTKRKNIKYLLMFIIVIIILLTIYLFMYR